MSLQVVVWMGGRAIDGVGTDWDEVERALTKTTLPLPLLRSIDPYEIRTLSTDDVLDLRVECDLLLPLIDGDASRTVARVKELTVATLSEPRSELRLIGD